MTLEKILTSVLEVAGTAFLVTMAGCFIVGMIQIVRGKFDA